MSFYFAYEGFITNTFQFIQQNSAFDEYLDDDTFNQIRKMYIDNDVDRLFTLVPSLRDNANIGHTLNVKNKRENIKEKWKKTVVILDEANTAMQTGNPQVARNKLQNGKGTIDDIVVEKLKGTLPLINVAGLVDPDIRDIHRRVQVLVNVLDMTIAAMDPVTVAKKPKVKVKKGTPVVPPSPVVLPIVAPIAPRPVPAKPQMPVVPPSVPIPPLPSTKTLPGSSVPIVPTVTIVPPIASTNPVVPPIASTFPTVPPIATVPTVPPIATTNPIVTIVPPIASTLPTVLPIASTIPVVPTAMPIGMIPPPSNSVIVPASSPSQPKKGTKTKTKSKASTTRTKTKTKAKPKTTKTQTQTTKSDTKNSKIQRSDVVFAVVLLCLLSCCSVLVVLMAVT